MLELPRRKPRRIRWGGCSCSWWPTCCCCWCQCLRQPLPSPFKIVNAMSSYVYNSFYASTYISIFGSVAAVYKSVLFIFILIHHLQSSQSVFWVHRLTFISPGNYKGNYQNKDFRQNLFNALYINISLYPSIYQSIHLLFYKYTYYAFIYLYR